MHHLTRVQVDQEHAGRRLARQAGRQQGPPAAAVERAHVSPSGCIVRPGGPATFTSDLKITYPRNERPNKRPPTLPHLYFTTLEAKSVHP
ncbi:hypothetical protein acdb102_16850 [Acidothermaceae bacterium B102]|nr:hypothetical protein acdb102_16850 [Acidothermaceae bacterium B102]